METQKPAWMEDEQIKEIPKEKLLFLEELVQKGQGKTKKEILSTMLPLLKKAKQENLSLTPAEMGIAIQAIKKYSSEDENRQIDQLLHKVNQL